MRGLFGSLAGGRETKAASTRIGALEEIWAGLWGSPSKAGVSVTSQTALQVTTVLACCLRIAEGTSTVPVRLYQRRPGERNAREATDLSLNHLIKTAPNEHQNSLEFRELVTLHARLTGNAYAWLNSVRGQIAELIPFEADALVRLDRGNPSEWRYTFRLDDGSLVDLPQREVWHLRAPAWRTWEGMAATKVCCEAIGLAIATEETHARLHVNGAKPGGLISFDSFLSQEAREKILGAAKEGFTGSNAFKTMVLDQGAKWTPFMMKGVDAEHLSTRRFQVEEICRGLGVLPIMVGHMDQTASYASSEQMFLHHVVHTIRPWHRRFEYSMDHQLLSAEQRAEGYYFGFTDTELLRGDHKTRAEYYRAAIDAGWMAPEEPRAFEDMPWMPGIDRPRMPLNTGIVGEDGRVVATDTGGGGA